VVPEIGDLVAAEINHVQLLIRGNRSWYHSQQIVVHTELAQAGKSRQTRWQRSELVVRTRQLSQLPQML